MRVRLVALVGVVALVLAGCAGGGTPEVTPSQETTTTAEAEAPEEPSEEPAETEEPAPSVGTREMPMKVGEARKLADVSAWTIMLNGSNPDGATAIAAVDEYAPRPAEGEAFLIGNFSVTVEAAAIAQQGFDLANEGADPWQSLFFEYVAADGTSYNGASGSMCYTPTMLHSAGTLYQDGATATGDVCIALPTDKIPGGLWRVSNQQNDNLWISVE